VCGTADTDERFRLIFDAYDSDGGGTISASELMRIAHEKGAEMGESLELVKNVMSTIDEDGTGQVDFNEFLRCGLFFISFSSLVFFFLLLPREQKEIICQRSRLETNVTNARRTETRDRFVFGVSVRARIRLFCSTPSRSCCPRLGAKNGIFFLVFPVFVPSLSCQNDRLYM
jgi:hypothetical protein